MDGTSTITKPKVDIADVAAIIGADIGTRFDFKVDPKPMNGSEKSGTHYCDLAIEQSFGVFAMVVASATVGLRAEACSDGTIWVLVDLKYEHHGLGRNGSTIGTYWLRDGEVENFRAN